MKKFSALIMAALLMLTLSACGKSNDKPGLSAPITEEGKTQIADISGTWQVENPAENGATSVVKVEIDNDKGFTFTTGTINPDGTASYYSHVGSYRLGDNSAVTFNATTGGESADGTSYQLKQDPGSYAYTYALSEDHAQMTLTPTNDQAQQLTGPNPVTLTKS